RPIGMAGPVKIGTSRAPGLRRSTLETWAPYPLEIVAQLDGGLTLERRFHAMFFADHTHREWFKWTPQLEIVIQAVRAGTFDVETLPEPKVLSSGRGKGSRPKWSDVEKLAASYR